MNPQLHLNGTQPQSVYIGASPVRGLYVGATAIYEHAASPWPETFTPIDLVASLNLRDVSWNVIGQAGGAAVEPLDDDPAFPGAVTVTAGAAWHQISRTVTVATLGQVRIAALVRAGTTGRARLLVKRPDNGDEISINGPLGALQPTSGDEGKVLAHGQLDMGNGLVFIWFDWVPSEVGPHQVRIGPDGVGTIRAYGCAIGTETSVASNPDPSPTHFVYVAQMASVSNGVGTPSAGNTTRHETLVAAKAAPINSIQAAVTIAQAGTAIVVQAGTDSAPRIYSETIVATASGTAAAPIWLVSETYRGLRVLFPNTGRGLQIQAAYWRVANFQWESTNAGTPGNDMGGAIYCIGDGTINGTRGYHVISGNSFTGPGNSDYVKCFNGDVNTRIIGNEFNCIASQESAIDLVNAINTEVLHNTFRGTVKNPFVQPKAFASGTTIKWNDFEGTSNNDGIVGIGGLSGSVGYPGVFTFSTAANVTVIENRIKRTGGSSRACIEIWGATNALIQGNYTERLSGRPDIQFFNGWTVSAGPTANDAFRTDFNNLPPEHANTVEVEPDGDNWRAWFKPNNIRIENNRCSEASESITWTYMYNGPTSGLVNAESGFGNVSTGWLVNAADPGPGGVLGGKTLGHGGWDEDAVYDLLGVVVGTSPVPIGPAADYLAEFPTPTRFIYVDPDGSDANATIQADIITARANPMQTITAAISAARADVVHPIAIILKGNTEAAPIVYTGAFNLLAADARPDSAPCYVACDVPLGARVERTVSAGAAEDLAVIRLAPGVQNWHFHNFEIDVIGSDSVNVVHVFGTQINGWAPIARHCVLAGMKIHARAGLKVQSGFRDFRVYGCDIDTDGFTANTIVTLDAVENSSIRWCRIRGIAQLGGIYTKKYAQGGNFSFNDIEVDLTQSGPTGAIECGSLSYNNNIGIIYDDAAADKGHPYASVAQTTIVGNRIRVLSGDANKYPVQVRGADQTVVAQNWFDKGGVGSMVFSSWAADRMVVGAAQWDPIPAQFSDFVVREPDFAAAQPEGRAVWRTRNTTIQDNFTTDILQQHALSTLYEPHDTNLLNTGWQEAADASVLSAAYGPEAWDTTAIYIHMGLQ